jgi:hypothetical protein
MWQVTGDGSSWITLYAGTCGVVRITLEKKSAANADFWMYVRDGDTTICSYTGKPYERAPVDLFDAILWEGTAPDRMSELTFTTSCKVMVSKNDVVKIWLREP